jgi:biofilm PGA synthesis N-glycosyltransferase PgaC
VTPLWQNFLSPLAELLFGAAFLFVVYTYAGYPLIAAGMARWRQRRWHRDPNERYTVSVIMPVHNGAAILEAKMRHLLGLDPAIVRQIIVVSDGSTDNTAALLEEFSDPRLKVLLLTEQVGKAQALNQALLKATSELVVFVDIRPRLEEDALRSMISNFADRQVGCVAGELLVQRGEAHDAAASSMGGAYWKYEQWIRTSEANWNSPVGVYGGFYAVRRRLSRSFPPGLILDDMFQPLTVIRQGYRSVLDRSATVTDTWPSTAKGEFQRKVRTLAGNFQLIAAAPWLLSGGNPVRFQLVSHKLFRLLVPYALLLMLAIAWTLGRYSAGWLVVAAAQTAFWMLALLGLSFRFPGLQSIMGPASALLVLNAAAVTALFRFVFTSGPLWKTWAPTATAGEEMWGAKEQS